MSVRTIEGIVDHGQIKLKDNVQLPDKTKVYVVIPDISDIESGLGTVHPSRRTPVGGLWTGVNVTDEDLAQIRAEMWGNFPGDDI